MSDLTEEDKLLESLCWSSDQYPLDEFLEHHPLPQVVCVEEGHYGENEWTSLGSGEVLILHALSTRKKLVGHDCNGKPLTITSDCPVKVHVYHLQTNPEYCRGVGADKLVDMFPEVRYVRALEGYMNNGDENDCFESDDMLEIQEIDKKNSIIRCWNMTMKEQLSFPFHCTAAFLPLRDYKGYTLEEVKDKFGLPAKVSFISAGDELSQSLATFGTITLLEEINEAVVISTTVRGTDEKKVCHILQRDLRVNVRAAQGLLSGEETYESTVSKLQEDFSLKKMFDPEQLAVYRDRSAIHRFVQPMRQDFLDHEPSEDVVRKHAEMRLKLSKPNTTQPPLSPEPYAGQSRQDNEERESAEFNEKLDESSTDDDDIYEDLYDDVFAMKTTPRNSLDRRCDPARSQSLSDSPALPPRNYGTSTKSAVTGKNSSKWETSSLPSSPRLPCRNATSKPRSRFTRSLSTSELDQDVCGTIRDIKPPHASMEPNDVYVRMFPLPDDLSGLTVEEIGEVLKRLNMERYVVLFEKEMINGDMLMSLDEECLLSLNLSHFHSRKLMNFINGWRPEED